MIDARSEMSPFFCFLGFHILHLHPIFHFMFWDTIVVGRESVLPQFDRVKKVSFDEWDSLFFATKLTQT